MVGDGGRWWEMMGDGGRWWEMVGDGGRWWETCSKRSSSSRWTDFILETTCAIEGIRRHQKASEGIRRHQKGTEGNRREQKGTEGIRRERKASEGNGRHQKETCRWAASAFRSNQKQSEAIRSNPTTCSMGRESILTESVVSMMIVEPSTRIDLMSSPASGEIRISFSPGYCEIFETGR